ncbi:hypothetical protein [Nocardiopsis kunsanensis]|uniref:hypothetical protein n=1 Tax=Nocardiopsis kunsanensis TaxID=141693 RepID=UPI00034D2684|nr:hypothetical protein [Nocardiopsis kunsanensis]
MNAVSPICLIDLAPALRWSKSPDVASLLHHDRLVEGWWNSLPVARVLEIAGPPWLAHSLARLAVEQWEHVPLVEFLPSLRGQQVECGELAEPVRTAVSSTAGHWERLVNASPQEIDSWSLRECRAIDVVSTVAWRALRPCGNLPTGPTPSPALMLEAVRTISHWLPESAPEHVRDALDYLNTATNADGLPPEDATEGSSGPPQTPATRAIRTLRALRAQRDREEQSQDGHESTGSRYEASASEQSPANGMVSSAAMIPETAHESSPAGTEAEEPGGTDLRSRFRSSLLGPGRTLRRPSFGPPKAMRAETEEAPEAPALGDHPLVDQTEQMIRSWPELERTVAAERLFATDPISIRVLSEQLSVDVNDIRSAQRKVEERLLTWLNSAEGASLTKHLRDLSEQLGTATTIDRLINAHADHPVDVPTLQTPMWRVVITLFTDRRMHNGWLIADDPNRLRWQTREMVTDAPNLTDAGNRLARIGIRQPELRAWLLSTPGINIRDGHVFVDPSVPMEAPAAPTSAPQGTDGAMTENGLPIRRRPEEQAPAQPQEPYTPQHGHEPAPQPAPVPPTASPATPAAPAAAHQGPGAPSTSARCFRAPDGRWWHRVDITADHLNGAPVAVPTGYATHLGLQPGRLLCLTAPGADLLVLVWRDHPAFDSLRPLLRRQAAQPGDRMFITVSGDRLDARKLPATDMSGFSPAARALHLSGYTAPASTEEALRILSRRITDSDESALPDPQSLLEHLSRRGDEDIAQELRTGLFATR